MGISNAKNEKKHIGIKRNVNIFGKYPLKKLPYGKFADICGIVVG